MHRLSSNIKNSFKILILFFVLNNFSFAQTSPHGAIKIPCTDCHTTESWKELLTPMKFNHLTTGFSLLGEHANVSCISCHAKKIFTNAPTNCFDCHQLDFKNALSPNHTIGRLSHDCLTCHTMSGWKPSVFQHSKTNFQLLGAHLSVDCISCHTNDRFIGLPKECIGCHQSDFTKTKNPNHSAAQFSKDCTTCHTINGWSPATFNHANTNFILSGTHATTDCSACHKNGKFKGTTNDCFSCHKNNFNSAPNHLTAQFSKDCLTCHSTIAWTPSTFDHNKTNFQLLGAHKTVECSSCHLNGQFKNTAMECYPCHQTVLANILNPNHITGQFSRNCSDCHNLIAWKPSTFDHNKTNFKLTGAHTTTDCSFCHKNGQFKGVSSDCYICHQTNFSSTVNPNHTLAQFSHNCFDCHTTLAWTPATFDHNKTNFKLTGAHITTDCLFCHKNGQFKGTTSDCYACHKTDFSSTINPNHTLAQFSHNCFDCHTTLAWTPATFDHNKTNFKLTGAHISTECSKCHINGRYSGTSADCFSCHKNDYNSSANPGHLAAQYPTACTTCHTTNGWKPSTFDHTPLFPINVGSKHRPGRWNFCSDCHTNPANYKVFSCITCHEHNKTKMDDEHDNVSGYIYESNSCYRCHPQGRD